MFGIITVGETLPSGWHDRQLPIVLQLNLRVLWAAKQQRTMTDNNYIVEAL